MSDLTQALERALDDKYLPHYRIDKATLDAALLACVEALENVLPHYSPKDLDYVSAHNIYDRADQALARLREVVGEK